MYVLYRQGSCRLGELGEPEKLFDTIAWILGYRLRLIIPRLPGDRRARDGDGRSSGEDIQLSRTPPARPLSTMYAYICCLTVHSYIFRHQ